METQTITLVVGDHTAETTAGNLGFAWNNPQAVEEAADSFETGNLIERYLARTDIEENQMVIPLDTGLDDGLVTAFVEENCASASVEAQDAQIKMCIRDRFNCVLRLTNRETGIIVFRQY